MLGLLETVGLVVSAGEVGTTISVMRWKKRQDVQDAVYLRTKRPREFRMIDNQLQKRALGTTPTKTQKTIAKRLVSVVRYVVNTKAFEIMALAAICPKSKFRQKTQGGHLKEVSITL
jgi:hypothetical protein